MLLPIEIMVKKMGVPYIIIYHPATFTTLSAEAVETLDTHNFSISFTVSKMKITHSLASAGVIRIRDTKRDTNNI